ncbi:Predicted arabinose efflux permease, MFS family [Blastococcus sp. DSM 46786]|uniref:MFS transporter n=1 Tax=Blastococcus sp. DSM 46786 TaxID=1798227 RepID=UPI0008C18E4D|nr:MFS transporter [Blastococcus sp. DSM 46786]SEK91900.1 Predicted arabinose efflux permease, MFS family [Blastococcus sp. DSM 46786]
MPRPAVFGNRDFNLYWAGVVLSQIGTRGTVAANYFHVYALTDSIAYTGLVGAGQAVALLLLSPLGGALADRYDRRRLLQGAQAVALAVALVLTVVTLSGAVQAWHVIVSVLFTTAAATFDQPARQALIPALVGRKHIGEAIALLNPSREVAVLVGPLLAGLLIAVGGPGLMYLVDVVTYAVLVVVLAFIRTPRLVSDKAPPASIFGSIAEGARYVVRRPLITSLMGLDLSATVLSAYRVLLPALATDVLAVGATGYGVLSSAPSAGALLATYTIFRVVKGSRRQGRVLLASTFLYGIAAIGLAQSPVVWLAVGAALLLGAFDAMATTIRHAAVQIDTPDEIRGRVTAFYQMSSRGGPAIGDVAMGAFAGVVGPVVALTVGGVGPMLVALGFWSRPNVVRDYQGQVEEEPVEQPAEPVAPPDARPLAGETRKT